MNVREPSVSNHNANNIVGNKGESTEAVSKAFLQLVEILFQCPHALVGRTLQEFAHPFAGRECGPARGGAHQGR
jgi:hypothetical protein